MDSTDTYFTLRHIRAILLISTSTAFTKDTFFELLFDVEVTLILVTHPNRYDIQGCSLNIHHGYTRFDDLMELASKWVQGERIDKK
jgi:hypothetical protein